MNHAMVVNAGYGGLVPEPTVSFPSRMGYFPSIYTVEPVVLSPLCIGTLSTGINFRPSREATPRPQVFLDAYIACINFLWSNS